ncbi:SRPBCC family protein [Jatrophihabitans endophyticus]|uniref:SRPBCC family protein n=1 Tax=Jatrophihabitans endophyticus TaxID=1206085 RepID=UPI0019F712E6|nr:SRPBCC family protein [Jatrophihabitans endophyticus]MBE7188565.1 SRPBCC family protein [Jatrophihabitans endophyticus]
MSAFTVVHDSPLPVDEAWVRLTDWPRHGDHVPFTVVEITTPPPTGVGTVFVARTGLGRLGFDDVMEIVGWDEPAGGSAGRCRIEKRGRVMKGWAELTVEPLGPGSRTTWREEAAPAHLPRIAQGLNDTSGKLVFGRVVRGLLSP